MKKAEENLKQLVGERKENEFDRTYLITIYYNIAFIQQKL